MATGVLAQAGQARVAGLVSLDGRAYPLKSSCIEAQAEGGIAGTKLTQIYDNPYQEPLEVLYTLPLPAEGAVTGYTIRLGPRVIRAEIRKREEAQREYRNALLEGRTAALLEQDRADTFTQQLGSLPAGQSAEIEIEVLQPLAFLTSDGSGSAEWEYRFPTVVGVRYEGARGRVPDAGKLDVDRADSDIPVRLTAALRIADGSATDIRPYAPGHDLEIEEGESGVRAAFREGMKLDRDLVVRWSAVKQEVGVRVVEGKGLPCDTGRYLLVTVTPPIAAAATLHRDLTLLIDASGSMSGDPLECAKVVASELLRSLEAGDRFEILAFATEVRHLVRGPLEAAPKNIERAVKALRDLEAGGATEMTRAVVEALKPMRDESQRQVILLSDGYIGFEGEVIGQVMRKLVAGSRVHTVGIGSAPNRSLTRGVARAGRGVEIVAGSQAEAKSAAGRLLRATVRPVLAEIEVTGSAALSMAPNRPQDVFEGQPLILFMEVSPEGGGIRIQGKLAGSRTPWVRSVEVPAVSAPGTSGLASTGLPIGTLFGRHSVEDLELEIAAARGGATRALEEKLEAAALRHGIPSRRTSLIAVSEDVTVDPRDPRRRERLPVEVPAGVSAEGAGLLPRGPAAPLFCAPIADMMWPETAQPVILAKKMYSGVSLPRRLTRHAPFEARVLSIDGAELIFEFEVPEPGCTLPKDGAAVSVEFDDGVSCGAKVVARNSSNAGPHPAGLTVRLALELERGESWEHGAAHIRWHRLELFVRLERRL
jgi:Ca-activated chloride channel homolog